MTYSISISRRITAAFIAAVFILGFIATPYWMLIPSPGAIVFHLALLIGIGLVWVFLSAHSFQVTIKQSDLGLLGLLFVAVLVLNVRSLNSVIPFRGDEALHIDRTLEVMNRIPSISGLILVLLFSIFVLFVIKKPTWMTVAGTTIVLGIAFYLYAKSPFQELTESALFFLRYPFINYWFFAFFPKLTASVASPFHEILFRVIPLLSMIGTAWVCQRKLDVSGAAGRFAWGVAIATMPLIFYYSSVLYIEPTAVFLMTVVCMDLEGLLQDDRKDISRRPAWYALILIGFIKETTAPFLLCFVVVRMILRSKAWLRKSIGHPSLAAFLMDEAQIVFVLLAPLCLYLYFRTTLTSTRTFVPHPLNVLDPRMYEFLLRSFWEQFGLFLLFLVGECLLLLWNRQFISLFSYLSFVIAISFFNIMDDKSLVGYSRFNLFILPVLLAASVRFIAWGIKQKQGLGTILVLLAVAGNLWLSPIHLDGVKEPYWGNYLTDVSEHYYPYQDALIWLKEHYPERRILFTGLDFYYPFQFYWSKLDWHPKRDSIQSQEIKDETIAISQALELAEQENYRIVVYRVLGENPALPQEMGRFQSKVIRNSAHSLIIFYEP